MYNKGADRCVRVRLERYDSLTSRRVCPPALQTVAPVLRRRLRYAQEDHYAVFSLIVNPLYSTVVSWCLTIAKSIQAGKHVPVNRQVDPNNQAHPRTAQQDNGVSNFVKRCFPPLPRLKANPGLPREATLSLKRLLQQLRPQKSRAHTVHP